MPSPVFLTIAAGQQVSSAAYLDRSDRLVAAHIASHSALGFHIAFASTSGGPTFARLTTDTGGPWVVLSGAGGGWSIIQPATAFCRIEASANVTATTTATLLTLHR